MELNENGYSSYAVKVDPNAHYTITRPELSCWTCHLFGDDGNGNGNGISWVPTKGKEPNWFWRKMQYLCLGNRWVYTPNK